LKESSLLWRCFVRVTGAVAGEGPVDRLRFHRYIKSLDLEHRYPGFISLNYAAYVPAQERKRFEGRVRRDTSLNPRGYPEFAIKPPGERPEYYAIVYLEPMVDYEFALGLDLGANPAAANPERIAVAMRSGRDSGKLTSSAQPLRVKRAKEAIYLAMRLAVYKKGMPVDTVDSVGALISVQSAQVSTLRSDERGAQRRKAAVHADQVIQRRSADGVFRPLQRKAALFDSDQLTKGSLAPSAIDASGTFVHTLPVEKSRAESGNSSTARRKTQ